MIGRKAKWKGGYTDPGRTAERHGKCLGFKFKREVTKSVCKE
jgi:hypothetical protein